MEKDIKTENKFIVPKLEIIAFINDDIITGSGDFGLGDDENGDDFPKRFWW